MWCAGSAVNHTVRRADACQMAALWRHRHTGRTAVESARSSQHKVASRSPATADAGTRGDQRSVAADGPAACDARHWIHRACQHRTELPFASEVESERATRITVHNAGYSFPTGPVVEARRLSIRRRLAAGRRQPPAWSDCTFCCRLTDERSSLNGRTIMHPLQQSAWTPRGSSHWRAYRRGNHGPG